jgi:predicted ArsR family transcriptional regulator
MSNKKKAADLSVNIEQDIFLRTLVRELAGTLEEVIGLDEASGFISIVGQHVGDWMNAEYRKTLGTDELSPSQVAEVLVDLKARINGDFYLIEQDDEKIVLGNRRCPFGDKVLNRPSMCMMTSNVFGTIAAENLGYAKVCLKDTIAQGSTECCVTVYKQPTNEAEAEDGREYYKA